MGLYWWVYKTRTEVSLPASFDIWKMILYWWVCVSIGRSVRDHVFSIFIFRCENRSMPSSVEDYAYHPWTLTLVCAPHALKHNFNALCCNICTCLFYVIRDIPMYCTPQIVPGSVRKTFHPCTFSGRHHTFNPSLPGHLTDILASRFGSAFPYPASTLHLVFIRSSHLHAFQKDGTQPFFLQKIPGLFT